MNEARSGMFGETEHLRMYAPAKINLILEVLGKRADGYHELATWMHKIPLYDEMDVTLVPGGGVEVHCPQSGLPEDRNNLVYRAADLFFAKSSRTQGMGASIVLKKHIPVAAGLGGGSSDAGTLLKGLNRYFGDEFDEAALIEFATSLGADVPFFVIDEQSVIATGIGEKMRPAPVLEACNLLLVNPGSALSTAEVFKNYALTKDKKKSIVLGPYVECSKSFRLLDLRNDLEDVAVAMLPVIAEIKKELLCAGADRALMSGSGATVFAIFRHRDTINEEFLGKMVERLRVFVGEKLSVLSLIIGV